MSLEPDNEVFYAPFFDGEKWTSIPIERVPATNPSIGGFHYRLGRSHWPELHTYKYTTEHEAKSFFADWWERRPKQCGCEDAEQILAANPIDFSDAEKFFASGVRLHNAVNAKLTKPELTIEEAKKIWLTDKQL